MNCSASERRDTIEQVLQARGSQEWEAPPCDWRHNGSVERAERMAWERRENGVGSGGRRSRKRRDTVPKPTLQRPDLVRLAGIEPTTLGFGGQYSIH